MQTYNQCDRPNQEFLSSIFYNHFSLGKQTNYSYCDREYNGSC